MRWPVAAAVLALVACSPTGGGGSGEATPVPLATRAPSAAPPCGGSGVAVQTTQAVDLATLPDTALVSVRLKVGDTLFIGASDCGTYRVPPASTVQPVLRQTEVRTGGFPALGAWYTAAAPGSLTVVVDCYGSCRFARYRVAVTVSS